MVDAILDRRCYESEGVGDWYDPHKLYIAAAEYGVDYVAEAMDYGSESDVKRSLCRYIDENGYSTDIKSYIEGVRWLPVDPKEEQAEKLRAGILGFMGVDPDDEFAKSHFTVVCL